MNKITIKTIDAQKWIKDYSQAVKEFTFGDHDPVSHLPFNAFCFYPLYFDIWLDKVYSTICTIEDKKINKEKVLEILPNYGSLKYIFYIFVNMAAYFQYDIEKAKIIFDFFIEHMSYLTEDDNLFREDKNIIKSNKEIAKILPKLIDTDKQVRQAISKLSGVLAMFNHALYNDYSTEYGYNIEGPYKIGRKNLLIKVYPDLCPSELWPNLSNFKIKNIEIIGLYSVNNIKMRFATTHLITQQNYQDGLEKYYLSVNKKTVTDTLNIEKIIEDIALKTTQIYLKTKKLNFEESKIKFLEQQGYELKRLFELVGINWRPDKKMIRKVKNQKFKKGIIKISYPKNQKEYEDYIGVTYLRKVYLI